MKLILQEVLALLILMGVGQMKAQELSSSMDERFNDGKMPYGWFAEGWMVDSTGVAKKGSASTGFDMSSLMGGGNEFNYLMTPPLKVKEGETLVFSAVKGKASGMGSMMGGSSDSTFVVERSVYGEHKWVKVADFTTELDSVYKTFTVSGTPVGEYRFRFRAAGNVNIDSVAGFQMDMEAPDIHAIYGKSAVKYVNLGVCAKDSTTTCTVINTATGTLKVNVSSDDESVFTVSPKELAIAWGDSVKVDIKFLYQGGHVGKNGAQIGFTPVDERVWGVSFIADAVIADPNAWSEDFNAGVLPKGWNAEGWKMADGAASVMQASDGMGGMMGGSSPTYYLVTPPLTFTGADEVLVFSAKNGSSGASGMMGMGGGGSTFWVEKSVYGSNRWEKVQDFSNEVDSLYKDLWVSYMEPGEYRFRFAATDSILIDRVAGFHIDNEAPDLSVTLDSAVVRQVSLSLQNADVTKTFVVTNTGTGTLQVNVLSSDEHVFSLSQTSLSIASGDAAQVSVTFKVDEASLGENNAFITFAPVHEHISAQTVGMQAYKMPTEVWSENFEPEYVIDDESEPLELPVGWETTGWTITKPSDGGGMMAMFGGGGGAPKTWMATTESADYELITPRLQAQKGDVMSFLAEMGGGGMDMMSMFGMGGGGSGLLNVFYRRDADEAWTLYGTYTQTATIIFKAPYSGVYRLMFKGQSVSLDDFQGFRTPIEEVALADGEDVSNSVVLEKYDGQVVNVVYDRVLSAVDNGDGTWTPKAYTFCLPYDLNFSDYQVADNVKLYQLSYIDNYYKQFIFADVEPYAKAGEAYLAVVEQGSVSLNACDVVMQTNAVETTETLWVNDYERWFFNQEQSPLGAWRGTFDGMETSEADSLMVYALCEDGSWARFMSSTDGETSRICGFRAYFLAGDSIADAYAMNPAPMRRVLDVSKTQASYRTMFQEPNETEVAERANLLFDSDIPLALADATRIPVIRTIESDGTHRFFDLQGRPLNGRLTNGIYIENGKKLMAR